MAVQSHCPLNTIRTRESVFDDVQTHICENQGDNLLRSYNYGAQPFLSGTVFSEPESELTYNVSGPIKRRRENAVPLMQQNTSPRFLNLPKAPQKAVSAIPISTCLPLPVEDNRITESVGTSTSGRPFIPPASVSSPLCQDLTTCLYQQNMEISTLIHLQNERLRLHLDEARKRHSRSLLSILEQQVARNLQEKEAELENASRRNAELEEKVRQIMAENQIWFNFAKNNEAIVSKLRSSLDQILLQNAGLIKEGHGDSSDGAAFGGVADDARSCCYADDNHEIEKALRENREMKRRKACKACGEKDVCVLLLPCRHLCLCRDCEPRLDTCPICKSLKNASLLIFMAE